MYHTTEKAIEQNDHLEIILRRLTVLQKMHEDSPNLEERLKEIIKTLSKQIPEALIQEQERSQKVRG